MRFGGLWNEIAAGSSSARSVRALR